jgi:hypothetical protein
MTVHILGCGPAGLAAAHAAVSMGHDIRIFSKNRKSEMFGAQYLHKPIPLLNAAETPVMVRYKLQGSITQYRDKVYWSGFGGTVSPEDLEENHLAWDIRSSYNRLWDLYSGAIEETRVHLRWMMFNHNMRPMINSIPLPTICLHPTLCNFQDTTIWAAGEAPERGIRFGYEHIGELVGENEVLCNGLPMPAWYRTSRIFGHATIEWPWAAGPNGLMPSAVAKPIRNSCQCWPDVLRVGRYGKWEKGVLVHHAFEETWQWLSRGASQS